MNSETASTGATSISVAQLRDEIERGDAPVVIDVRRRNAFVESTHVLSGALRRDPALTQVWVESLPAADSFVVYCVHGGGVSQDVAKVLTEHGLAARYLDGGIDAWASAQGPLDSKPRNAATRWVTRERPKIDRIACPWFIARFVDAEAQFLYVRTAQVPGSARDKEAIPYDIPDVHFSHDGDRCSFDAFLAHYRLRDPALAQLALIVRGADTAHLELAPQAAGLAAISLGPTRRRSGWQYPACWRSRSGCRAISPTITRCSHTAW